MLKKLLDIITRNYLGLPTTPAEKAIYLAATTGVMVGSAYALQKIMPFLEPYLEQMGHPEDEPDEDIDLGVAV